LNAEPIAALRIAVGKSSAKSGPKPANIPVPNPTRNMKASTSAGRPATASQKSVVIASPTAISTA